MTEFIRNFIWFCAGADANILRELKGREQTKAGVQGTAVLLTAILAFFSGGYAIYFVFSGSDYAWFAALFVGLLWAFIIFNLDRSIVINIQKRGSFWRDFLNASPRILLAIILGIVIARPLEMRLLDKEIRDDLKEVYAKKYGSLDNARNEQFSIKYASQIEDKEKKRIERDTVKNQMQNDRKTLQEEYSGISTGRTTGVQGFGRRSETLQKSIDKQQKRIDTLEQEMKLIETFLANKREEEGLNKSTMPDNKVLDSLVSVAGFKDRNQALSNMSMGVFEFLGIETASKNDTTKKNTIATIVNDSTNDSIMRQIPIAKNAIPRVKSIEEIQKDASPLVISLLFILLECLPVIVKLMNPRGPYDLALEREEERLNFLSERELRSNKLLIDNISEAQNQIMYDALHHYRRNELSNISSNFSQYFNNGTNGNQQT